MNRKFIMRKAIPLFLAFLLLNCKKEDNTNTRLSYTASFGSEKFVILVDFDGCFVNGTLWDVPDFTAYGANISLQNKKAVMDSIVNHFRIFNGIVVTTDESKFYSFPANKRVRAIATTSRLKNYEVGISIRNSVSFEKDIPCFVFTQDLNFYPPLIAIAISHEIGHTLGLKHQAVWNTNCRKEVEFNKGDDINLPIMGYYYGAKKATWWVGSTSTSCSDIQNDSLVIANAIL